MKKLFFTCIIFFVCSGARAQVMAQKMQWVTIKSANLRCWECKEKLEKYLTKENYANMGNGLAQWRINLLQGEIRLQYYPDRVSPDDIRTAMNNAGFDADSAKAEPDSYKTLPLVCKRPEEGGGPQKGKPCHIPPGN
jgi:outer membrane protein OmpA-like peptidoglycan-associated protein